MALTNGFLQSALMSAFETVLDGKTAIYAAVPVTSGLRLWKLASELKISDLGKISQTAPERYAQEVFVPNSSFAQAFAASARKRYGLVIDPSRLVIPDWSQQQYWLFWEQIILRCVKTLLLSPEWEYSRGCVYECIFAVKHSIPVISAEGEILDVHELRAVVSEAIRVRESLQIRADFLDEFMSATGTVKPGS